MDPFLRGSPNPNLGGRVCTCILHDTYRYFRRDFTECIALVIIYVVGRLYSYIYSSHVTLRFSLIIYIIFLLLIYIKGKQGSVAYWQ